MSDKIAANKLLNEKSDYRAKFNIFIKFSLIISLFLILILTLIGIILINFQEDSLLDEKFKSNRVVTELMANISSAPIQRFSYFALEEYTAEIQYSENKKDSDVLSVLIYDNNNVKLNPNGREIEDIKANLEIPKSSWNVWEADIINNNNEIIGKLIIVYSLQSIFEKTSEVRKTFIIIVIITIIVLAVIIMLLLYIFITKPLVILTKAAQKLSNSNFDIEINHKSNDEIGFLGDTFVMMSKRLKANFREIEKQNKTIKEYNESLEEKVEQRTIELKKAFEEVNQLKIQQDGDYFLTSLLLKPLFTNSVESENVNVEFYYSQKKKFIFKKWNEELGGDICIAHSIILHENNLTKEYSVFVNGDAMGKSIQGAGGSLVLGVVFNAFVTRTKFVPIASSMAPEEWLVKCYRELQDIFVSFDGSMLISVVMGIVDDKSGMMYYFNAEHPWTVLYRNKKAEFIESELLNRKIGTTVDAEKVKIKSFQLHPQDVIIAGSDGRDDLLLEYDEETKIRIINEDENLFLKSVEIGKGKLEDIVEDIQKNGELTDDLSLLRIGFKENQTAINENIPKDFYEYKSAGASAYQNKKYKEAIEFFERALKLNDDNECYNKLIHSCIKNNLHLKALTIAEKAVKLYPGDLDIMFSASFLYKKDKQYDRAIYYGKRYQIHKDNIKNLINLADSYRLLGDYKNAKKIVKEADKLEPNNINIKKLKKVLDKIEI